MGRKKTEKNEPAFREFGSRPGFETEADGNGNMDSKWDKDGVNAFQ